MPVLTDTSTQASALARLDVQVRATRAQLSESGRATSAASDLKTYFSSGKTGKQGYYGKLPHWHMDVVLRDDEIASWTLTQLYTEERGRMVFWLRADDKLVVNVHAHYGLKTTTREIPLEELSLPVIERLIESLCRLARQFSA